MDHSSHAETAQKKVVVFGTGFAGKGHAQAFRDAGADVVGIVGRTPDVVEKVAKEMGIPYFSTNLNDALTHCKPDIVSVATPGGAHVEAIQIALDHGCHIFCDKPMTESSETANALYQRSVEKGVKTAFAASFCYMPHILQAKKMVEEGWIGEPLEAEFISHFNLDRHIPFGWSHRIESGGGRLNNNFTHLISIATSVIGDQILSMQGHLRNDMTHAPVVDGVHNFMERRQFIPKDLNDPNLTWRECNVEWSYSVMAQIESRIPATKPVSVLFHHSGLQPRFNEDYIAFYGSKGAIYIKGNYGAGPLYFWGEDRCWKEIPLPESIKASLPAIDDDTQRSWTHLATLFVADLMGNTVAPYPTFKEGAQYQSWIDQLRENNTL